MKPEVCRRRTAAWPKLLSTDDTNWCVVNPFRRRFHRYVVTIPYDQTDEAAQWCIDNIGPKTIQGVSSSYDSTHLEMSTLCYWTNGRWDYLYHQNLGRDDANDFLFRRQVDATAFKLVWG